MAKKEESTEQLTPQQQKLKALQAAMAKALSCVWAKRR